MRYSWENDHELNGWPWLMVEINPWNAASASSNPWCGQILGASILTTSFCYIPHCTRQRQLRIESSGVELLAKILVRANSFMHGDFRTLCHSFFDSFRTKATNPITRIRALNFRDIIWRAILFESTTFTFCLLDFINGSNVFQSLIFANFIWTRRHRFPKPLLTLEREQTIPWLYNNTN